MAALLRHGTVGIGKTFQITPCSRVKVRNGLHTITNHVRITIQTKSTAHRLPRNVYMCAAFPVRHNSSNTGQKGDLTIAELKSAGVDPATFIPEPPAIPDPSTAVDTLNALGEPTLSSLGLGGWWPPGLVQSALETLHVTVGLPWWGCIVLGTVFLRIAIFPIVIKSQQNAANMANNMPTMTRLQQKFTEARAGGNPMEAAKAGAELMDFMQRNEVKPFKNFLMPMFQLPIFVSVFVGLRRMANLPVGSMATGGMLWFTDLTLSDPYYLLPLMTMGTFLLTVELGAEGMAANQMGHIMKWIFRCMPVIMFPVVSQFPAAMCVYWFTSNFFSLCQVSFLRVPQVRDFFKIPIRVKHENAMKAKPKGFLEGFRDAMDNSKTVAKMEQRQKLEAVEFKKAGIGPIQKTYKYDPTKHRTQNVNTVQKKLN